MNPDPRRAQGVNPSRGGRRTGRAVPPPRGEWLETVEGKVPPGPKAEPAWPLWVTVPRAESPPDTTPVLGQAGRGCRRCPPGPRGASSAHLGRLSSPGRGRAQVFPFLPGLGRESPTWPYTGTEQRRPLPPGWADGAGLSPSLRPALDTIQGFVCSQPGDLGLL